MLVTAFFSVADLIGGWKGWPKHRRGRGSKIFPGSFCAFLSFAPCYRVAVSIMPLSFGETICSLLRVGQHHQPRPAAVALRPLQPEIDIA